MAIAPAFGAGLRSLVLARGGAPAAALAELAASPAPGGGVQGQLIGGRLNERFLRATSLEALDRNEEALVVYGSLIYGDPGSTLLAVPAALHRARLLARLGREREARRDYETTLSGWARADAALQPVVDSARRELARLP
jgi:hypothetical protein